MVSGSFSGFWASHSPLSPLASEGVVGLSGVATSLPANGSQGRELQQSLNPLRRFLPLIIILFASQFLLAQQLEENIYNSLDQFIENPSEENLEMLQIKEATFETNVTSEEEKLALLILDCNLGYYNNRFGRTQFAIDWYEKAWKLYEENKFTTYDISEFCLKPLGNLYTITGAFTNAESTIKQYIHLAEEAKNPIQRTSGVINLSVVYHNTGNYQTAILILEKELQNKTITKSQKAALENNLATNLFAIGKTDEAQEIIDRAIKNGSLISAKAYKNAAQIAVRENDFQKAENYLFQAERALSQNPDFSARELAKLYQEQAQLYMMQQKDAEANKSLQKSLHTLLPNLEKDQLPEASMLYAENTFLDVLDGLAHQETDLEIALQYFDLSFYVSQLLSRELNSQEAKILHQLDDRVRSEKCIALLFDNYQNSGDDTLMERAFNYAERSKAVVLSEMQLKRSLLSQHLNDTLLQKEQQLIRKQEALINNLVRAQLSEGSKEDINNITFSLNSLHLELKTVAKEIALKYPEEENTTVAIETIQQKLLEDSARMYYFFFGREVLYTFRISNATMELQKKPITAKFSNILLDYIHSFDTSSKINDDIPKYTKTAFSLYQELDLKNHSKVKNLVIIPDGLLNFVSFEALLTEETNTINYSKMPFLVKAQSLAYNTTAGMYANSSRSEEKNKVLGVFPVFYNTKSELKFSVNESESLDRDMNSTLLMREQATKANFLNEAPRYNILHLSTHASGGDFVIPANIQFIDDVMLLHELYSLDLHPELVVLSACETGIGKLQKGEGAMSVARGFQYAGAKNLLFSLWKVNDLSTAQLMDSFYKSFRKNESAFVSNHLSKLKYLQNGDISTIKKSPYYWSSFVYYGGLSEAKTSYNTLIVFVGLTLLVLFIVVMRKKRT
ncbi:CHAT domain-containing protein [Ulvibacter antarcticus]|uniref:CHAT domain-containing protein n=1 Tax=Ulvibacter antarcticus TaxID=442714 RepID=A0A3L9Y998_9FLAO|nr:CHAT domain-containing protein [Ulvibacter antarcticus]RMA57271.1 CHAT domain-containing protein [Ulvibacter antarcticus]